MNELALFAGAGGGILGGHLLGWKTVCAVEINPYAASVLVARQNDGILAPFPIWDDVCTFDGKPWRGIVDVISGGFPCQDISVAGKGTGITGERSGLWKEFARIIGEVRPQYVFVENSPMLTSRGLGTVLGDLATLGYDAEWGVLGAVDAGAPHRRERIWIHAFDSNTNLQPGSTEQKFQYQRTQKSIGSCNDKLESGDDVADTDLQHGERWSKSQQSTSQSRETWDQSSWSSINLANTNRERCQELHITTFPNQSRQSTGRAFTKRGTTWWETEPNVGRLADEVASRVDELTALGNGQVPAVARLAWRILT